MRAGVAFVSAPGYEAPAGAEDEIPLRATWKRRLPIEGSFCFPTEGNRIVQIWRGQRQVGLDKARRLPGKAAMDDTMVVWNKPVDSIEFL
jgi:hypothetical protein